MAYLFLVRPLYVQHETTIRFALLCAILTTQLVAQQPRPPQKTADALQKLQAAKMQRKKQAEAAMAALEQKLGAALAFSVQELQIALQIKLLRTFSGARVFADDERHTFLGVIADEFDADSIFNDFGTYGSEFSSDSIWNQFGEFGGEFSSHSPFSQFTSTPPLIVKDRKVMGRLTVNKFVAGAIDPNMLKSNFKY